MGREIHTVNDHLFAIGVDFVTELRIAVNLLPIDMHIVVVAAHLIIARHDIPVGMHLEDYAVPLQRSERSGQLLQHGLRPVSGLDRERGKQCRQQQNRSFHKIFFPIILR